MDKRSTWTGTFASSGGTMPQGWTGVRFGSIARPVNERVSPSEAQDAIYIGLEHLDSGSLKITRWGKSEEVTGDKLRFRQGDIIFGRRRAYQRKLAVADFDGICSAHAMVLQPIPETVEPSYLPYFMSGDPFMARAQAISVGSLSPTINWSTLRDQVFALPSRDMQIRIAEILRAADLAVESKRRLLADAEACDKLLSSRVVIRGLHDKGLRETEIGKIPSTWEVCRLTSLMRDDAPITYGIVQPGEHDPDGVLMVLGGDFINGWVDKSKIFRVRPELHRQYRRSRLSPGDLIMCIVGVTTGAVQMVPDWGEEANLTQTSARIACNPDKILPEFLLAYLRSSAGQAFVRRYLTGSRQVRLNLGDFDHFWVPVPTLAEQRQIVEMLRTVQEARFRAEEALARQVELARSLSLHVFSGAGHVQ